MNTFAFKSSWCCSAMNIHKWMGSQILHNSPQGDAAMPRWCPLNPMAEFQPLEPPRGNDTLFARSTWTCAISTTAQVHMYKDWGGCWFCFLPGLIHSLPCSYPALFHPSPPSSNPTHKLTSASRCLWLLTACGGGQVALNGLLPFVIAIKSLRPLKWVSQQCKS